MSVHRSLKGSTQIKPRRNVLKRYERIDKLMREERWHPENGKAFGLPKTKPEE